MPTHLQPKTFKDHLALVLNAIKFLVAKVLVHRYFAYGIDKFTKDILDMVPPMRKPKKSIPRAIFTTIGGVLGGFLPYLWSAYQTFIFTLLNTITLKVAEEDIKKYAVPTASTLLGMSLFAYLIKHGIKQTLSLLFKNENLAFTNTALKALTPVEISRIWELNPRLNMLYTDFHLQNMNQELLKILKEAKELKNSPIFGIIEPRVIKKARELLLEGHPEEFLRIKKIYDQCTKIKIKEIEKFENHVKYLQNYQVVMGDIEDRFIRPGETQAKLSFELLKARCDAIKELKERAKDRYEAEIKSQRDDDVESLDNLHSDLYESFIREKNFYIDQIQKIRELMERHFPTENSNYSDDSEDSQYSSSSKSSSDSGSGKSDKPLSKIGSWMSKSTKFFDWLVTFRRKKTLRNHKTDIHNELEKLPEKELAQVIGNNQKLDNGKSFFEVVQMLKVQQKNDSSRMDTFQPTFKGDPKGNYAPLSIWAEEHPDSYSHLYDYSDSASRTHETRTNVNSDNHTAFSHASEMEAGLPRKPPLVNMMTMNTAGGNQPHLENSNFRPSSIRVNRRERPFRNYVL